MPNTFRSIAERYRFDSVFWRQFMASGLERLPEWFMRMSPPAFGIGFGIGLPAIRHRVQANLRLVLGHRSSLEEARDVAAVFSNYAHCLTEAMLLGTGRGYRVEPRIVGVENYNAAAAARRGIIIATAHTGGWDVAGSMLHRDLNQEIFIVMVRERDQKARALQDELRKKAGVEVVHIGDSPFDALPLLGHLKRNAVVAMQIDRSPSFMRSREVFLLDKPWRVPEGPLRLAAASGAPLMPVFTRRLGFMQYEAILHPPVYLPRKPTSEQLDAAAQSLMDALGSFLRTNPTMWFDFAREEPDAVTAAPR